MQERFLVRQHPLEDGMKKLLTSCVAVPGESLTGGRLKTY